MPQKEELLPTEMTKARKELLVNNLNRMASFALRILYLYGTQPPEPEPTEPKTLPVTKEGGKAA